MKIDVLSLSRMPGESMPVKLDAESVKLIVQDTINQNLEQVFFDGSLKCTDYGVFKLEGRLKAVLRGTCDRCLEPALSEIIVDVDEQYRLVANIDENPESDEYYGYAGHSIIIDQAIRDNLLLNIPLQVLCKENCSGFCPKCGRNLNEGDCGCVSDNADDTSPFGKLSKLLQDDEGVLRT